MWSLLSSLEFGQWVEIGGALISLCVSIFMLKMRAVFVTKGNFGAYLKAHAAAHEKIDDRLGKGDDEFNDIKGQLQKLATAEQVNQLRINLTEVKGEIGKLEERLDGHIEVNERTERTVDRIEEFLLHRAGV